MIFCVPESLEPWRRLKISSHSVVDVKSNFLGQAVMRSSAEFQSAELPSQVESSEAVAVSLHARVRAPVRATVPGRAAARRRGAELPRRPCELFRHRARRHLRRLEHGGQPLRAPARLRQLRRDAPASPAREQEEGSPLYLLGRSTSAPSVLLAERHVETATANHPPHLLGEHPGDAVGHRRRPGRGPADLGLRLPPRPLPRRLSALVACACPARASGACPATARRSARP